MKYNLLVEYLIEVEADSQNEAFEKAKEQMFDSSQVPDNYITDSLSISNE
jgi:hypothetical protein